MQSIVPSLTLVNTYQVNTKVLYRFQQPYEYDLEESQWQRLLVSSCRAYSLGDTPTSASEGSTPSMAYCPRHTRTKHKNTAGKSIYYWKIARDMETHPSISSLSPLYE